MRLPMLPLLLLLLKARRKSMKFCPSCKASLKEPIKQKDGYYLYHCDVCQLHIFDPTDNDNAKQKTKSV